jgi:hypothetical protein
MRCNFLRSALAVEGIRSLADAQTEIRALDPDDRDASKVDLSPCGDRDLRKELETIRSARIHLVRNEVIHKAGRRPTIDEVDAALVEARVLFTLAGSLGVKGDDINVYVMGV